MSNKNIFFIDEYVKKNIKNFNYTDFIKNQNNNVNIEEDEFNILVYIIIELNKSKNSELFRDIIIPFSINNFIVKIEEIYKNFINNNIYNIIDLIHDIKKYFYIDLSELNIETSIFNPNSINDEYYLLFKIGYYLNNFANKNTNSNNSYDNELIYKLCNYILTLIYKKIVITINNICFIVLSTYYENNKQNINIISFSNKNIINKLTYYRSESELGLMRFKSLSDNNNQYAKYLDYAVETLINFELQKKIIDKFSEYKFLINNNKKIFNDYYWLDTDVLNLLNITNNNEILEENRAYFSLLFYCFYLLKCGNVFNNYDNNIKNIISSNSYINIILKKLNNNLYTKDNFIEFFNLTDGMKYYEIKNFIEINSLENNKKKIIQILNYFNNINCKIKDNNNICKLTLIYVTLGQILDVIIDDIIEEETDILNYSTIIVDNDNKIEYIFNIKINKMVVKIDNIEYNLYYNEYTIDYIKNKQLYKFDNNVEFYRSLIKIVLTEKDNITDAGLTESFIIAGFIQCKPVEYNVQLKNVDVGIINYLNSTYSFIGLFINEMFKNFDKFNKFKNKKEDTSNLKNKYLKYKNKYLKLRK